MPVKALVALILGAVAVLVTSSSAYALSLSWHGYFSAGIDHPTAAAYSPNGETVYMSDFNSKSIYKFDVKNRTYGAHSASMPGDAVIQGVAASPDGKFVYVTTSQSSTSCGFVYLKASDLSYQGCTNVSFSEAGVAYPAQPKQLVVNSAGTRAYLVGSDSAGIHEIDLKATDKANAQTNFKSLSQSAVFGLNERLAGIAISPDGSTLFITERDYDSFDSAKDRVFVLSTAHLSIPNIPQTLQAPFRQPTGVAVSPDGSKVFVSDNSPESSPGQGDNQVFVFNARTHALMGQFDATSTLTYTSNKFLAVSPDSTQLAVVNASSTSSLSLFSTSSYSLTEEVPFVSAPRTDMQFFSAAFAPNGATMAFVSQTFGGLIIVDVNPALSPRSALSNTGTSNSWTLMTAFVLSSLGIVVVCLLYAVKRRTTSASSPSASE
ncbi:MAG: hypothetical protein RLZZ600_553 [Actinomycetota bacterium]